MSLETLKPKVAELIEKAEAEKFLYELSGTWTNQFSSGFFRGATKILRLNFENAIVARSVFNGCLAEIIDYYINCSKATDINRLFQSCPNLKFLYGVDTSSCANCTYFLSGCSSLETIQIPFDFSLVTQNASSFNGCVALKNIRFVAECIKLSISFSSSSLLSDESIQSIIDGLATVETAQTLTLHADVKAKLTQTQLDTITSKNWSVA